MLSERNRFVARVEGLESADAPALQELNPVAKEGVLDQAKRGTGIFDFEALKE